MACRQFDDSNHSNGFKKTASKQITQAEEELKKHVLKKERKKEKYSVNSLFRNFNTRTLRTSILNNQ